ncbi:MAG: alpha/beta hydrolase family protein [Deinococcales bacterium]
MKWIFAALVALCLIAMAQRQFPIALAQRQFPDPNTYPNSIVALQARDYSGSQITLERRLKDGSSYRQWIASYRSDGLKILALLTIPKSKAPKNGFPVVVFNHGYIAPEIYRTTEKYLAYQAGFASKGYIVFKPDYRGHGFSEGKPASAYTMPDYTIDVMNAVSSIKKLPQADPNNIGIWGHSMGGYLALRTLVLRSGAKAAVIWGGVVAPHLDIIEFWSRRTRAENAQYRRYIAQREALYKVWGSPSENPAFWRAMSANTFITAPIAPVQLHHGISDDVVPVQFSKTLATALKAVGSVVELYAYPRTDHNLTQNFSSAMRRSVAFFDRYLKVVPKP